MTTTPASLGAIVLAAGASRRMGRAKALLQVEGETFLERWLRVLDSAGVGQVRVVVAPDAAVRRLPPGRGRLVIHPHPDLGMLSSFQAGLRSLPETMDGAYLCPVDHPRIGPELLARMAAALKPAGVVVPVYKGRRGHPVLFGRDTFVELMTAPLDEGARHVVRARPGRVVEVPADEGVLTDVNTPEDYRRL